MNNPGVPRVNQLEAITLDQEFAHLLQEQFLKPWKLFKFDPSKYQLEVYTLFLGFLLCAEHGARLQAFQYAPSFTSSWHRCVFILGRIGVPYLLQKLHFPKIEGAWTFVQLLHSYWFLVKGKYPTVIDRLCKIRPHPWPPSQNHRLARQVSYTFMYRQLLWTSVTDTLSLLLPFIPRWYFYVQTFLSAKSKFPPSVCGHCRAIPLVPVNALPCSCLFCYYCSYGKKTCARCHEKVVEYQRI